GTIGATVYANVVEDEELSFRPDVAGVGDAGAVQVFFSFDGDVARILGVIGTRDRVLNVADDVERGVFEERINEGRFRVGHHEHVGLVDLRPAADGGGVEAQSVLERLFVQFVQWGR